MQLTLVIPGLDPGIHPSSQEISLEMDCRVKPGNDELWFVIARRQQGDCDLLRHGKGLTRA